MKIFIFQYIHKLTGAYHSGGGLVVIARDKNHVLELISNDESIKLEDNYWNQCESYNIDDNAEAKVYIFPDKGCC